MSQQSHKSLPSTSNVYRAVFRSELLWAGQTSPSKRALLDITVVPRGVDLIVLCYFAISPPFNFPVCLLGSTIENRQDLLHLWLLSSLFSSLSSSFLPFV